MFERDLPGENSMGFNQTGTISELPLEMCETMNGSWGFNIKDQDYKSTKQLIQTMVKSAGYGANFLLNTGPMPNGKIQPENVETLLEMGEWLDKYGETIYETRRGPIRPQDWGATTSAKNGTVYIHLLEMKDENLLIPSLPGKIKSLKYFDGGEKVKFEETEYGVLLNVPKEKMDKTDTILVLTMK